MSRIAQSHGGLSGGASAGKSGYDLTFAIAYLRDFALLFDVLGESFETFVSWTALEGLCEKVRRLILLRRERERDVARVQGLPPRLWCGRSRLLWCGRSSASLFLNRSMVSYPIGL